MMKRKRVFLILALVLTILLTHTSCIMIPRYTYYSIEPENVSAIYIYNLRNCETWNRYFLETELPVHTIEETQKTDFLKDLSHLRFSDTIIITIAAVDPSFSYGEWVVRVNYTDGAYCLISCGGFGETFDENNEVIDSNHFGCDDEEWERFVSKYVPKEIFNYQE